MSRPTYKTRQRHIEKANTGILNISIFQWAIPVSNGYCNWSLTRLVWNTTVTWPARQVDYWRHWRIARNLCLRVTRLELVERGSLNVKLFRALWTWGNLFLYCICLTLFSVHVILLCNSFCCFCVLCYFLSFNALVIAMPATSNKILHFD